MNSKLNKKIAWVTNKIPFIADLTLAKEEINKQKNELYELRIQTNELTAKYSEQQALLMENLALTREVINQDEKLHELRIQINELLRKLSEQQILVNEGIFRARRLSCQSLWQNIQAATYAPPQVKTDMESFSRYLEKLRNLYPHLYEEWHKINFEINPVYYRESPLASCSIESHKVASSFAGFIAPYLSGNVLDIGCGPHPLPVYLDGYPIPLISGIDPLPPFMIHPFQFIQGFAEYLPWYDDTFSAIVAATSLDHVFSLELARDEIKRTIKKGGFLLVWDGFIRDSQKYNPEDIEWQPVDEHHLFHFDEEWFEEFWCGAFVIREKVNVDGVSFFYALQKA